MLQFYTWIEWCPMCTTACLCSVCIWIQCSCCLIPSAYSVSRSKSCFKCRQTHIRADSYPNKHIEPVRSIVCLCLERSRTQRATQTNRIKTGTATTVSKRTLCWSRHIEIREQYFFFSWDWALFFFLSTTGNSCYIELSWICGQFSNCETQFSCTNSGL